MSWHTKTKLTSEAGRKGEQNVFRSAVRHIFFVMLPKRDSREQAM
jgi:hypothetical protein